MKRCNAQDTIYFFRHFGLSRNEARQLRDLIEYKYPNLDFVLVAVGNNPTYEVPWKERKIQNYYLNDTHVWNDSREWKRIFSDLGILEDKKAVINDSAKKYAQNLCGHCFYCQRKKLYNLEHAELFLAHSKVYQDDC